MDGLVEQFAALEVIETHRHSNRMPLPPAELLLEFEKLVCLMMRRRMVGNQKVRYRCIKALFGAPPLVLAKL
jgi:hypothetical protein